jgi:hypothetical protein
MPDPAGSRHLSAETELKKLLDAFSLRAHAALPKIEWPAIPTPPDPPPKSSARVAAVDGSKLDKARS